MTELTRYTLTVRRGGSYQAATVSANKHGHIITAPAWLYSPKPGNQKTTLLEMMTAEFWAGQFVWCEPIEQEQDDENNMRM